MSCPGRATSPRLRWRWRSATAPCSSTTSACVRTPAARVASAAVSARTRASGRRASAVSVTASFYLATHTALGWVFGAGLSGLAVAWIVTTSLAYAAIRRGLLHQHQEWMIRSYVVTFGFVFFRILVGVLQATGVGSLPEQLAAASWFCWAAPLLVTEAILQGRKIFAVSRY